MKVWLIHYEKDGCIESQVECFDHVNPVFDFIRKVKLSEFEDTTIKGIYNLDLDVRPIRVEEFIPRLHSFQIELERRAN